MWYTLQLSDKLDSLEVILWDDLKHNNCRIVVFALVKPTLGKLSLNRSSLKVNQFLSKKKYHKTPGSVAYCRVTGSAAGTAVICPRIADLECCRTIVPQNKPNLSTNMSLFISKFKCLIYAFCF